MIRGEGMASGRLFGVYINAGGVALADLTVRDVQYHGVFIDPSSSPSGFLFHNIRVVDCGEQLLQVQRRPRHRAQKRWSDRVLNL